MKEGKYPRKLRIDIEELISAMENASYEQSYYLDLETGRILLITDETRGQLEEIYEEAPDRASAEELDDREADLESFLKQLDLPDWQKKVLRVAYEVEKGFGERYLPVPQVASNEDYGDLEDFITTVEDAHLEELLEVAINGKGAFRRFKDVLLRYPEEKDRWFRFKEQKMEERAREWLEDIGITLREE